MDLLLNLSDMLLWNQGWKVCKYKELASISISGTPLNDHWLNNDFVLMFSGSPSIHRVKYLIKPHALPLCGLY